MKGKKRTGAARDTTLPDEDDDNDEDDDGDDISSALGYKVFSMDTLYYLVCWHLQKS